MIPPMPKSASIPEEDRIYIDELARLTHRQVGTIRRWEADKRLPKHLLPKGRGKRRMRYWTHAQVHGARGILVWMAKNDMRPGRLITDPDKEHEHVEHLRKPKHITGHHINTARHFTEKGWSRERILKKIYPRTKYNSMRYFEPALERSCREADPPFDLPAPKEVKKYELSKAKQKEIERLAKKVERVIKVGK